MGVPDREEFVASRTKAGWGLLGSLAFVAIATVAEAAGDADWMLRSGLMFFGLCALIFAWLLARPQRLKLDPEGFTLSGGLMRPARKIAWQDVGEFYVRRLRPGASMVAFTYSPDASVPFGSPLGSSGGLPGLWPDGPEEIVWRLNQYKEAIGAPR